ncbi:MAG: EAL domain-containing protein [Lawsonibacter sp.]|jgi:diguanylate cyclase (GGDEF)-like protein
MRIEPQQTAELYRNMLNALSESSDDYFFLWEVNTDKLYFSGPIEEKYPLALSDRRDCGVKEWLNIVYPQDLPQLQKDLEQIQAGKQTVHNQEYRILNRAGEIVLISCRGKVQLDAQGQPVWMLGRVSDTLVVWKADRLTGAYHMDMLKAELNGLLEQKEQGHLLLVGVDNLKFINLKRGREYGDQVLKRVAWCLEDSTNGKQRIYRMNGDCFAVNLPGMGRQAVEEVFQQMQKRLEGQCTLSGGSVPFLEYHVPNEDTLYQYAENSLDCAKAQGKNTLWFFSADDYEKDLAALELREELEQSIQTGYRGFSVCYQAQVASHTFSLHGAEALLRFESPRQGVVEPEKLIAVLEQTKLIVPVGLWVLRTALEQCRQWREKQPDFCISVNMSYVQLCQEQIAGQVLRLLKESGLPGRALTIEITESMQLYDYPYLNEIIKQWKRYGITISVDDFGTGYSSLERLKQMRVDEIKIDRCFVHNIQRSAYNYRLMSNIMELADSSQVRVCCEGVESTEELEVLEELNPHLLQGFLFSKQCTPEVFQALYLEPESPTYQARVAREAGYLQQKGELAPTACPPWTEGEIAQAILEAESDIYYVSDLNTYEVYYLSPAGQKLFGVHNYYGKKCYKLFQGLDEPCPFCTNRYLKKDEFYIWAGENQYCGRRFILKDKLLTYQGKRMRMEVALDVTKHEIVSTELRERLSFAEQIAECTATLSKMRSYEDLVEAVLAALGQFYQADHACLFEPDPERPEYWRNAFEWCGAGSSSMASEQQQVPVHTLEVLIPQKSTEQAVIFLNIERLERERPQTWELFRHFQISRIMAVPLWINGKLCGLLGVDNPRYAIDSDTQLQVLSHYLSLAMRKKRDVERLEALTQAGYSQIMGNLGVGLWVIRLDPETGYRDMLADETMLHVLGITDAPTAQECYQFWYSRINDGYYDYVNQAVESMIENRHVVQLEYTWKHPVYGEVVVRCTGIRAPDQDGMICLEGYHRMISNIDRPQFMSDVHVRDVFEYNEVNQSIFFHKKRSLLAGEEQHEGNFPQCWIEQEIVHPHFAQGFQELFTRVRIKGDREVPELLLKSKEGTYEWFRLNLRHLGQDQKDLDTVVVVVEPTGAERVQELENIRIRRFYQALLSEAIAYAEVDLESGQVKDIGGVWSIYEQDRRWQSIHFIQMLEERLTQCLAPQELELLKRYRTREGWETMFRENNLSHRFCYRRPVDNEVRWVELVIHIFREDTTQNVYALMYLTDINAAKQREMAQLEAARRDPLTGVYNRVAFEQAVKEYVSHAEEGQCGVLLLLDIDNFKMINDDNGHLAGDQALQTVSHILTEIFRPEDLIGRLGGDEFLVFYKGSEPKDSLRYRLKEVLKRLQQEKFQLSSSIGATWVWKEDFDYRVSLNQADVALYQSKKGGKNSFCFFEKDGEIERGT